MPLHEPSGRAHNGEIAPDGKVRLRRDADGKLVPVLPDAKERATSEAKPKPRQVDDPRPATVRNIPPFG
jgi:hypothetical protein